MTKHRKNKRGISPSFYSKIKDYRRIVRSGISFTGGVTIYGNNETLAIVTVEGFTETVKYISLKNIRAVLIRRYSMEARSAVVGLFLVLAALITFKTSKSFNIGFLFFMLEILLAVLVLLGVKNCSLRIVTDVNDHHIASIHRCRMAEKVLAFIVDHIQPYLAEAGERVEEDTQQ